MKSSFRSRSRRRVAATTVVNSSARQAVERSEPKNLMALGHQSTEDFRRIWQIPKLYQISHASYSANDPCEDRFIANSEVGMFGVFDGHGGHLCSSFLSEYAVNVLLNHLAKCQASSSNINHSNEKFISAEERHTRIKKLRNDKFSKSRGSDSDSDFDAGDFNGPEADREDEERNKDSAKGLAKGVGHNSLRDRMSTSNKSYFTELETNMKKAFFQLDDLFMGRMFSEYRDSVPIEAKSPYTAGSCGVVVFFHGSHITVANVGDSRAVLGQNTLSRTSRGRSAGKQHTALPLSFDQRASDPKEQEIVCARSPDPDPFPSARITANKVVQLDTPRVAGSLIVTRAFGDGFLKYHELSFMPYQQFVPYIDANPDLVTHEITPADECIIIASDGLWDLFSNEEAVAIAMQNRNSDNVAQVLIDKALESIAEENGLSVEDVRAIPLDVRRTIHDDITVVVIFLNERPLMNDRDHVEHSHPATTKTAAPAAPRTSAHPPKQPSSKHTSAPSLGIAIAPTNSTPDLEKAHTTASKDRKPKKTKAQTTKAAVKKASTRKAKVEAKKPPRVDSSSGDDSGSDKAWKGPNHHDDDFEDELQPKSKAAANQRPKRRSARR